MVKSSYKRILQRGMGARSAEKILQGFLQREKQLQRNLHCARSARKIFPPIALSTIDWRGHVWLAIPKS